MKIVTVNAVTQCWNANCPECGEEVVDCDSGGSHMIDIYDEYAVCMFCEPKVYVIPRQKVFRPYGKSITDIKESIKKERGE